jgi:hypothetical protein
MDREKTKVRAKADAPEWPKIDVSEGARYPDTRRFLDRDSLYLVERNLVLPAVIKLSCPRRFVVSDLLRDFKFAAVLQIHRNAGRAEGMIANARFDAGRFRAPADDAMGVLLEEWIGGKLASLAAGGTEEIAVDVIGDAGGFDILVQTLIETMMAGNVVLLAAFFV